jgi:predicted double-glycine peptidase
MKFASSVFLPVLAGAALLAAAGAEAEGRAPILADSGRAYTLPVHTIKELKLQRAFATTVRQQFDFSCGSAALATLLTHHYGRSVSESEVFQAMFKNGDQAKIRREGFSLLDMKRYLTAQGFQADGVQVPLDTLANAGVPAIALISDHGYRHFVVVKGRRGDRVVLGDPALGTRVMPLARCEDARVADLYFVIRSHRADARFNGERDWTARLPAPLAVGVGRDSLATLTLAFPSADHF